MTVPGASHASAATNAAVSNRPPRLVLVVLPFENATGNGALDDWQQTLPALVRSCLGSAEGVRVPGWKKLEPSLTGVGWADTKAVDPEWARQVARDLKAGFALWGSFQLQTNGWAPPLADGALSHSRRTCRRPTACRGFQSGEDTAIRDTPVTDG
jgi:hypothetical protein